MSILSSLYHGEIRTNPNATHNVSADQAQNPEHMEAESAAMGPQPISTESDESQPDCCCHPRSCGCAPRKSRDEARRAANGVNCLPGSRAAWQAKLEGDLEPDLFYSHQQGTPEREGWVESGHTVSSKLEEREEYPYG